MMIPLVLVPIITVRVGCLHRLLFDPAVDVYPREPPSPANLEGRDFFGGSQPVDRPFGDLQIGRDLLNGEDLALAGTGWHCDVMVRLGQTTTE